jgi:tetratricopeptide (TPR) repeat protein
VVARRALFLAAIAVLATFALSSTAPAQAGRCAAPNALVKAGSTAAAKKAYEKLLVTQPTLLCARARLAKLNAPAAEKTPAEQAAPLCAQGKAYERTGRDDDAEKAYKSALEKDPSKDSCGEQGLASVDGAVRARLQRLVSAVPNVSDLLAIVGLGLAAFLVLLMLGYIPSVYKVFRGWPIVGSILGARLSLADLEDGAGGDVKSGAALTARIKERLQRFREESDDDTAFAENLDFGTGSQDLADIVSDDKGLSNSLDNLGDIGGQAKIVAALLGLLIALLPIRRLSITGVIEPHSGPRASATLSMETGQQLSGAVTITGRTLDHDPASGDYLALAGPSAVWVSYNVARALADKELPLERAESYALAREGLDLHDAGDAVAAIDAFTEAIALDARNWAARVNLAITQARLAEDIAMAVAILAQAVDDFENEYAA